MFLSKANSYTTQILRIHFRSSISAWGKLCNNTVLWYLSVLYFYCYCFSNIPTEKCLAEFIYIYIVMNKDETMLGRIFIITCKQSAKTECFVVIVDLFNNTHDISLYMLKWFSCNLYTYEYNFQTLFMLLLFSSFIFSNFYCCSCDLDKILATIKMIIYLKLCGNQQ